MPQAAIINLTGVQTPMSIFTGADVQERRLVLIMQRRHCIQKYPPVAEIKRKKPLCAWPWSRA